VLGESELLEQCNRSLAFLEGMSWSRRDGVNVSNTRVKSRRQVCSQEAW
jgi:hypothetical protein